MLEFYIWFFIRQQYWLLLLLLSLSCSLQKELQRTKVAVIRFLIWTEKSAWSLEILSVKRLHLSAFHLVGNEKSCDMTTTTSDQCIAVRRAVRWMQIRCPVTISLFPVLCSQPGGAVWSEELMVALWQTMRTGPVTDRNVPRCAEEVITASSVITSAPLTMLASFASHRNASAPSSP